MSKILALGNEETTLWVENSVKTRNMEVLRLRTLPDNMGALKQENFNLAVVDHKVEDLKNVCFRLVWLGRTRVAVLNGDIRGEESDELRFLGVDSFLSNKSGKVQLAAVISEIAARGSPTFNPIKVLVIEDDKYVRESIRLCFKLFWPEAKVSFADDGHSGIENISNNSPDIVILDLGLPDMSGYDVLKRIRFSSRLPVVILSAARDKGNIIEAIETGANDYIVKPFKQIELIPRIKKYAVIQP
jgi:CheY-like chemotaxis protein